jgi:molybdenum cofactor sulfurtransferase
MAKDQEYAPGRDVRPESMVVTRDSRSPIEDSLDLLRILEYPQLHGKTYLDHAGTTVSARRLDCVADGVDIPVNSCGPNPS